jgi:phosphatidylglycerophosphate synthase
MLLAAAASLVLRAAWPAALVCSASLLLWIGMRRGEYTPAGGFGAANLVTTLRLALIVLLAWLGLRIADPGSALLVFAVFVLDGIDGSIARRRGLASAFGARLDMECDALLVLVSTLLLYLRARVPLFILVPGLLRYAYVLALPLLPSGGREQPPSRVGRYSFSVLVTSLIASLWPIEPWQRAFAGFATLLVVYSFARSVYWSWSQRAD